MIVTGKEQSERLLKNPAAALSDNDDVIGFDDIINHDPWKRRGLPVMLEAGSALG
jgi:hypothetical protein